MESIISVVLGLTYSLNQFAIIKSIARLPDFVDSYEGTLSALMYFASLFTLALSTKSYKYCILLGSILMSISPFISNLLLQRIIIGLGSPHFFNLMLYSSYSYNNQIFYTNFYNMSCMLGISLGILLNLNEKYFTIIWIILIIFIFLSKKKENLEEVYLQQVISIEAIYFISFISELLGEIVILSTPMVLTSVWE